MKAYFADTSYYVALLLPNDRFHQRAMQLASSIDEPVYTSDNVLMECAAFFAKPPLRAVFSDFVLDMRQSEDVGILSTERDLLDRAWTHYFAHRDKSWSLVDYCSFLSMRNHAIENALTSDHHFMQAGFNVLMPVVP